VAPARAAKFFRRVDIEFAVSGSNVPCSWKSPSGPGAPASGNPVNRRADVAKVETFLGRTGH
jgi:hypothetical protein